MGMFIGFDKPGGPDLAAFHEQIKHYTDLRETLSTLPTVCELGWLRLDARPARTAMLVLASQWSAQFTDFLLDQIHEEVRGWG